MIGHFFHSPLSLLC